MAPVEPEKASENRAASVDEDDEDDDDENFDPDFDHGTKSRGKSIDSYIDSGSEHNSELDSGDEKILQGQDDPTQRVSTRMRPKKDARPVVETKPAPKSSGTSNMDELWANMNRDKPHEPVASVMTESQAEAPVDAEAGNRPGQPDMVKIVRSYEFAGKTTTEEKMVPRESAEAKAFLADQKEPDKPKSNVRRPKKRVSQLEANAAAGKNRKLNTLEKSRLDWAGFVDKEGIHEDLQRANKDGYVERQEFLQRVEANKDRERKGGLQK